MCGLSGIAGEATFREEKIFKALLIFSSVRGMDSTGAASVSRPFSANSNVEFKLAKEVGPFPELFDTKKFDKLFYGSNMCFIGHNRSKTVGEVTKRNAHPFEFDDIIGAHNGTISGVDKARMKNHSDFRTDSEAIFNNIQEEGIEKTIGKIEKTEAYALTWYDVRDNSINFLRNDQRPLCYAFINEGKTIVWASEYGLLMAAIYHAGFKPDQNPWEFTENIHYSFKIPLNSSQKFPEPVRRRYENWKRPVVTTTYSSVHDIKKNTTHTPTSTIFPTRGANGSSEQSDSGTTRIADPGTVVGNTNERSGVIGPPSDPTMVWCGHYIGWVKRKEGSVTTANQTNLVGVPATGKAKAEAAFDNAVQTIISEARAKANDGLENDVQFNRGMTADEWTRKNLLIKAEEAFNFKEPEFKERFRDLKRGIKIWQHLVNRRWFKMLWNYDRSQWDVHECGTKTPSEVPFSILDIQARHQFKHIGRAGNKKPYYRGFKKNLLSQDRFEKIMQQGCANCNRIPEWGNEVSFFTSDHDFLCEWCSGAPGMFKELLENARKKVA